MMFIDSDFIGFMFYRDRVINDKVEECLNAIRNGRSISNVDFDGLTSDERSTVVSKVKQIAAEYGYNVYGNNDY